MNTLNVSGMSCNHCREAVLKAVSAVPGVGDVTVELSSGKLTWTGPVDLSRAIGEAVSALGFAIAD